MTEWTCTVPVRDDNGEVRRPDNSIASDSVRRVGSRETIETLEPWSKYLQRYGAQRLCR